MKTYMNGQVRHVDSEMATKYQLSKVYTKVQSTINSMSAALSGEISGTNKNLANLDTRFVEKSAELDSVDRQLGIDIREVSVNLTTNTNNLNSNIQAVSSALDNNVQSIHTTINSVEQDLTNKIDITATNASAYTDITNTNLANTNNHLANTRLELDNVDTSLSASIDSLSTTLYNEKDSIMQWATLKDDDLKRDLSAYIDESIANLGSVYELIGTLPDKSIATSVDDLPSGAEKGDIYFIKSTLSDGTSAITQYICIDSAPDVSRYDKWQKFGTTVDLSNYYTIDEVKAADEAILYSANTTSTNQVTTLDNTLRSLIDKTARDAATDASTKSNDALTNGKAYTDELIRTVNQTAVNTTTIINDKITATKDELNATITNAAGSAESKSNTYTDKVSGLLSGYLTTDITKILTDADTVALNNAKKYTDGEIVRLNDALVYADGQALLSAKNYTDAVSTQINTLMINGDAAAKDTAINIANANIATLKSTLEAADSAVLVEAKVYTNQVSGNLNTFYTNADAALRTELQQYSIDKDGQLKNQLIKTINTAKDEANGYTDNASKELIRLYENADIALSSAVQIYVGQKDTELHNILSTEIKNAKDDAYAYTDFVSAGIAGLYGKKDSQIIGEANRYSDGKDSQLRTQLLTDIAGAVVDANNYVDQVSAALQKIFEDNNGAINQNYAAADIVNYNKATAYTDERQRLTREAASGYTNHVSGLLSTAVINYTKQQTDILNNSITTKYNELNTSIDSKHTELNNSINSKYNELSTAIDNIDLHDVIEAKNYTDDVSSALSTELTRNILAAATQDLVTQINSLSAIYAPKTSENIKTDTTGKPEFGILSGNTIYDLNADDAVTMLTFYEAEKSYLESIIYFKTGDEFTLVMPENIAYIQNGIEFDATTKRPVFKPNTRYIITVRNLVARIETIEEPVAEPAADPEAVTEE